MFLFAKPEPEQIKRFLAERERDYFSYPEVGATGGDPPSGYNVDHNKIRLGTGPVCFDAAKDAIRRWEMFALGWVELFEPDTPIEVGQTVAILVHHFGFLSLNAARIVYTIEEPSRFGFAYGTLTEHGEIGEERFSVECHPATEEVWYDLYAFSRPGATLARLGYPLSRYLQKRFARDSMQAMLAAVEHPSNA